MPQRTGDRTETAVDDRTQLLAPVTWETSPVRDELLLALRDVASRDGGRELAGEAFDLAEQRQAERHKPRANDDDPWKRPPCGVVAGMFLAAAVFVAGIVLGAVVF